MRRGRRTDSPNLRGTIACCLLAVVALSLGPSGEAAVRSAVRDAARPGFLIQRRLSAWLATLDLGRWPWTAATASAPPAPPVPAAPQAAADEQEIRRLRAALAAARGEIAAFDRSLGPVRRPAATAERVERVAARILRPSEGVAAGGVVIGAGSAAGTASDQVAVEPGLLTAGRGSVSEDATVLAGAAVVGRVAEVGVWTSTLLPVTDPAFRAHVWLVRESDEGPESGEEGILEGDGRGGCVVRYVPSTAAVSVGDHVYSRDPTGRLPQPLYYGRVERAELRDGAPHWEIRVRPAADPAAFAEVHVLVPTDAEPSRPVTMAD